MEPFIAIVVIFSCTIAVMFIISAAIILRDRKIRTSSTHTTQGTVIRYSVDNTKAPIVEYEIEGESYQKGLKYSMLFDFRSMFIATNNPSREDLLKKTMIFWRRPLKTRKMVMEEVFPAGSKMTVYYNPEQPKIAYVERFAPSHIERYLFLGIAVMSLTMILLALVWQ